VHPTTDNARLGKIAGFTELSAPRSSRSGADSSALSSMVRPWHGRLLHRGRQGSGCV